MSDIKIALAQATVKVRETAQTNSGIFTPKIKATDDIVASFFNVEPLEAGTATIDKMNKIKEWISSSMKKPNDRQILKHLKKIKTKLGEPRFSMSNIDHIYNYLKLKEQARSLDLQAEAKEI